MLENIVHNELINNGYSINVGTFEKYEKDKNGKSIRLYPFIIDMMYHMNPIKKESI